MRPIQWDGRSEKLHGKNLCGQAEAVGERLAREGFAGALEYYFKRLGFRITTFYYTKETLPEKPPQALTEVSMTQHPRSSHSNARCT
jgi:hypothetical protein